MIKPFCTSPRQLFLSLVFIEYEFKSNNVKSFFKPKSVFDMHSDLIFFIASLAANAFVFLIYRLKPIKDS